ncbi:unnamed protein product [Diamesa serratosioi]
MKIIYFEILCVIVLLMKEATGGGDSVPKDFEITSLIEAKTEPTIISSTITQEITTSTTLKATTTSIPSTVPTTLASKPSTLSTTLQGIKTSSQTPPTSRFGGGVRTPPISIEASTTTITNIPVTISNLAPEDQPLEDCIILPSGEVLNVGGDCFSGCDSTKNLSLYHIDDSKVLCCCKVESS